MISIIITIANSLFFIGNGVAFLITKDWYFLGVSAIFFMANQYEIKNLLNNK